MRFFFGQSRARRVAVFLGQAALLMLTAACQLRAAARAAEATPAPTQLPTVALPTSTPTPAPAAAPLVGLVTRAAIEAYPGWPTKAADGDAPDAGALATIKQGSDNMRAILFLGTWDEASRREVPRLFRVLDGAGVTESSLSAFALDETLKDADGIAESFDVQAVPTLILFKGGREIGRMVNWQSGTLASAMAQIIADGSKVVSTSGSGSLRCH